LRVYGALWREYRESSRDYTALVRDCREFSSEKRTLLKEFVAYFQNGGRKSNGQLIVVARPVEPSEKRVLSREYKAFLAEWKRKRSLTFFVGHDGATSSTKKLVRVWKKKSKVQEKKVKKSQLEVVARPVGPRSWCESVV